MNALLATWERLEEAGRARGGADLAGLTTYKMGGPARWLVEPADEEGLLAAGSRAAQEDMQVLALGKGSNLVISDRGYDGMVVRLGTEFAWVEAAGSGEVSAGGGATLPIVARTAGRAGWGGLEFFVGVPGSVGGAVRMNAGCHGKETVDVLLSARVVDLASATASDRAAQSLGLAYRHSDLGPAEIVTAARFAVSATAPETSEAEMRAITRWRKENQPGGALNAGSVFRNPPGDAAGRLIDRLGLKGFRVGGASVSEKHANFFVAEKDASAQDVYDLVWAVRRMVGERVGIWLEPEIRFAGSFRPSPDEETAP
jgi:UDP-N-acetylmuramate dehydrogenase